MLKHLLFLIILSLLVVLAMPHLSIIPRELLNLHAMIVRGLNHIFTDGKTALLIRDLLAILAIPLGAGVIIGGFYWAIRRTEIPFLMSIVWSIWLVLVTILILQK